MGGPDYRKNRVPYSLLLSGFVFAEILALVLVGVFALGVEVLPGIFILLNAMVLYQFAGVRYYVTNKRILRIERRFC